MPNATGTTADSETAALEEAAGAGRLAELERRLVILEERTTPKPKSFIERVAPWTGIATVALAFLYTFPLGVWDRFVVTPLAEQRALISKLQDIDIEFFKTSQALPRDQMLAVTLSARAKKTALLVANRRLIEKWKDELSTAEIQILGYHSAWIGDPDFAMSLYKAGIEKERAQSTPNQWTLADLHRMQAELMPNLPGRFEDNVSQARDNYARAVETYMSLNPLQAGHHLALTLWSWTYLEGTIDGGACAEPLARAAIAAIALHDRKWAQEWSEALETAKSQATEPPPPCVAAHVNRIVERAKAPAMTSAGSR